MPFVYLARGQAAAASARADVCVCVCVCSHLPAPLPLIRADYTPQLVSQQLITPRQDQSYHLLKISRTWQQKATAERIRSQGKRERS
ncbi:hypothetical protein QQF64_010909 [Cirrhinus molitorella]|uniref:Secreted protein n=1 Tax=Cirrhinus molitorella TaxID=172907 RepID=A0ABR3LZC5_9TELE